MQAKELRIQVQWVREDPDGEPHGDVHLVAHARFAPKTTRAMCGVEIAGMRKQSTPFTDWQKVVCAECYERLEI